jgi:hypothetical protein
MQISVTEERHVIIQHRGVGIRAAEIREVE